MTELLENSDNTNADTGVRESSANEATISLAVAQSLADALQKIESYTPTVWVDNESPDIDAAHLNKAEQAIMRVTTAMNSAVDVIKDLQSQVNTTNNNLSNAVKVSPASIKNAIIARGNTSNRFFDLGVTLSDGTVAYLNVDKDTARATTYKNGTWTDLYTLAKKSDLYPSYDQITLFSDVKADVTNKSITITENGMVQAAAKTQATEGAAFIRLIINGTTVYEGHTASGKYRYLWTPIFLVKKGDIIKVTLETGTSDGQRFVYFYKS